MRFLTTPWICLLTLLWPTLILAQGDETPELTVLATFDNAGSIVKNGQANRVVLSVTKAPGADRVLTLEGVTGAFLNDKKEDGQKGRVLRNMTTTPFKSLPLRSSTGKALQVPFDFWPEFAPGPLTAEFRLLINDGNTNRRHNVLVGRYQVTVVEPKKDLFDLGLLSVYAILAILVGATGYAALQIFNSYSTPSSSSAPPKTNKPKARPPPAPAAPSASGYDEEWIPETHLKAKKSAASSGDESPAAGSPAAAARRRHRK